MFERLATVRLKTAEDAFADGRIDEAFDVASMPDLAGHRRTQVLLNKLAEALLSRGQDHLMNRRFPEALADFDRAARCGHATEKVVEWRNRALIAARESDETRESREEAMARAQAKMAAGSLVGAKDALEAVARADAGRAVLEGAIKRQTDRAEAALEEAEAAFRKDELAHAVARLRAALQLHSKLDGAANLEARLVSRIVGNAMDAFRQGRLGRAEQQLALLSDIGVARTERIEANEALRLAREAGKAVGESRYAAAGVLLGRLAKMELKADWIGATREQLDQLDDLRRTILEGPLSCFVSRDAHHGVEPFRPDHTMTLPPAVRPVVPPVVQPVAIPAPTQGHRRLMLRIDGVGSYLLLNSQRVSIGRAGAGATADLQLISDLADRQAEIIRSGDDYFVAASGGVELAGRSVEHALLQDGDKVRLGHRVRLRFLRPSRKSAAAVLELGEGVRMASDCRKVILLGGPLVIGPRRDSHIVTPGGGEYVLIMRDGAVILKTGGTHGSTTTLALGAPLNVGDLRIGVQAIPDGSTPGRVVG